MPIEKLEKAVGNHELLEIVKRVTKKRGLEIITGKPILDKEVRENENEYRSREIETEISYINGNLYKLKQKSEYSHEHGTGGYRSDKSLLLDNNKQILLETKDSISWNTYLDDSEDHVDKKEQYTILHSDNKFAEEIFMEIKLK